MLMKTCHVRVLRHMSLAARRREMPAQSSHWKSVAAVNACGVHRGSSNNTKIETRILPHMLVDVPGSHRWGYSKRSFSLAF